MADVFVSYKREERVAVERIASTLRGLGVSVWFDASMSAGETFSDEIDREAHAAKAILVCWSPTARESQWVKSEALIGFEKSKLAACYVAGPDGFYPPTPFNSIHAEDLRAWLTTPSDAHSGWKSILRRIGKLCARTDIESYGALDARASASELNAWLRTHRESPLFVAVEGLLQSREAEETERARLEQEARDRYAREAAARQVREAEEDRARAVRERASEAAGRQIRPDEERRPRQENPAWVPLATGFVVLALGLMVAFQTVRSSALLAFLQQWQIAVPIVLATMAAFAIARRPWSALYVGLMPFINWSFAAVPTSAIPDWLGGGQFQPLAIVTGLVLVVRDFAQRELKHWIWGAMVVGLALSTLTSWITIVVASGAAFVISETVDWAVYTFIKRPLSQRVMLSSLASAPLDQVVFIALASLVVPGIFAWGTILTGIFSKLLGAFVVSRVLAMQEIRAGMKPA